MTEPATIICPDCRARSASPHDIASGYCGRCRWWTSDPDPAMRASNPLYRPEYRERLLADLDATIIDLAFIRMSAIVLARLADEAELQPRPR